MTDESPLHQDEPLEGDIGPAAATPDGAPDGTPGGDTGPGTALGAAYDFGSPKERRAAIRRYEAEREERRRRTDAASGRIASMLLAVLLAFMTFDSGRTAVQAHRRGDDWLFPPGALAIVCGIALVVIIIRVLRRGPQQVN
ncbi:hypothetical protein [Actinomadura algeriensis]|uniref:Uncharacterized protein n=1 Tax=Actinomadura algeriensis TaxID=1679523 RepID=A0ABR9JSU1_9ACTN|nr:hypothetical protein [Actinomadura algeriensis]MBE1533563.1 hypothetical protein [Actinomadura algeriensis]